MNRAFPLIALLSLASFANAEWNSFRGPNHDGTIDEKIAVSGAPKLLWKVPVGEGFGTMSLGNGKVYVMAESGGQETCIALDAASGKEAWHYALDKTIFEIQGGNGPRSTPFVDGKFVYIAGTYLKLACLDAQTGKPVWTHDLVKEFGGQSPNMGIDKWGSAASPVVDDKHVYVSGGGKDATLLAFDKLTGKLAWKAGDEKITHATPTLAKIHGVPQIIFFCQSGLISLDTATGAELWRYKFDFKVSSAASPIVGGDLVYCSAGYGVGAGCAQITRDGNKFAAKELWRKSGDLMNHWMTPIHKDGHLYGLFGFRVYRTGPVQCVEMATGKVKWSKDGFGQGGVSMAQDQLIIQGDQGQIAIVRATPDKYTEIAAFQAVGGKAWNAAIVSGGKLFARSTNADPKNRGTKGELACYEVGGK